MVKGGKALHLRGTGQLKIQIVCEMIYLCRGRVWKMPWELMSGLSVMSHIPITLALGSQRQEDQEFKASLIYLEFAVRPSLRVRLYLKKKKSSELTDLRAELMQEACLLQQVGR